jgi:1-acyl-sn-glycerol-3-phosphate acyltransferase
MPAAIDALTQINLDDLVNAFGVQNQPALDRAVRFVFRGAARKFAKQMLDFDAVIARCGLADAARQTERLYVRDVRVFGLDHLPDSAFLALSNHPGMTDTLALFCALNRGNLKIIALNRPFLLSLPNLSRQLFYVTDDPNERVALVRGVSAHLRNGGSILTFPAGHTEPDPDVYDGALESLKTWTDSAGVFIRFAPKTAILPIVVRHVIWEKAARHPLIRFKHTRGERELLAAALELLSMVMFDLKPVTVKIQVGKPITAEELGATETQIIHQAVLAEMRRLIENPPAGEGISAL